MIYLMKLMNDYSPGKIVLYLGQSSCGYELLKWIGTWWTLVVPKIYAFPNLVNRFLLNSVRRLSGWVEREKREISFFSNTFSLEIEVSEFYKKSKSRNFAINRILKISETFFEKYCWMCTYRNFCWETHTYSGRFLFGWTWINEIVFFSHDCHKRVNVFRFIYFLNDPCSVDWSVSVTLRMQTE